MNAVCDMTNGNLRLGPFGPDVPPHTAGHLTVKFADSVHILAHPQPQNKHGKFAVYSRPFVLTPGDDFIHGNTQPFFKLQQVGFHQLRGKFIMSSGNRRVGSKHRGSGNDFPGRPKINAIGLHDLGQPFQTGEYRVTLIHMKDPGSNPYGFQSLNTADSQQDLLGKSDR